MSLKTIAATALLASSTLGHPAHLNEFTDRYDYVIVGGGTFSLVVANRLSENPSISVAVIEAGDSVFANPNVTSATGYGKAFGTAIDWAYESTPQKHAGNATQTLRAAKALGRTSTINGMTYLRAEDSQIDAWQKLGNIISWASLLPYYTRSEYFQTPTSAQEFLGASYNPAYHGFSGPLAVGWPKEMVGNNLSGILNASFASLDLPWNGEPNAEKMRGFNSFPKGLIWSLIERPNLDVYLNSFVQKLEWETKSHTGKPSANGVSFTSANGTVTTLRADREVIFSAGSLRSPLILELSGIGSRSILEKNNITVVVDNLFVGENLQDQTTVDTTYTANQNFTGAGRHVGYLNAFDVFGNSIEAISQQIQSSLSSYANRTAAASSGVTNATVLEKLFQIQHDLIVKDKVVISEIIANAPASGSSTVEYWGLMSFSRGNIHIGSSNASAPAMINPNYFMLDYDIKQQIGTARMARKVANASPLSGLLPSETQPGLDAVPANATDAVWGEWLEAVYRSNFHYISTAAMMAQELGGVVDDAHMVYGTANVRVVDASVLPSQVS